MQCLGQKCSSSASAAGALRTASSTRHSVRPGTVRVSQAVTTVTTEAPTASTSTEDAVIYVGKGRYIRDDPRKYPQKDDIGFLKGATGGWAGGEAALLQFREEAAAEKAAAPPGKGSAAPSSPLPAAGSSEVPIYVGYGKSDLEIRKSGAPGRFILDDPAKYPSKEDLGPLKGATGGFAGGEKGVAMLVEQGELRLRTPGSGPPVRQFSPVALAGLLVAAGAGGGVLLTGVTDLGEMFVKTEIVDAPIDDKTKALLLLAVVLLGGAGAVAGARVVLSTLQSRLSSAQEGAQNLVVYTAFSLALFVAARTVLEL